jgi:hypothetical protein
VNPIDRCEDALQRAGWAVDDARIITTATEPAWLVSGSNGVNRINARAATQSEAWSQAVEQTQALGMQDGGCRFFA